MAEGSNADDQQQTHEQLAVESWTAIEDSVRKLTKQRTEEERDAWVAETEAKYVNASNPEEIVIDVLADPIIEEVRGLFKHEYEQKAARQNMAPDDDVAATLLDNTIEPVVYEVAIEDMKAWADEQGIFYY